MTSIDLEAIAAERDRIRRDYLHQTPERPESNARGLHHFALLCSDVRRTIDFYQGVLEFPLTEVFENRDYAGSNPLRHRQRQPARLLRPAGWEHLRTKLDAAGVEYMVESETSVYVRDPDGARLELLADPLGEMYGTSVR